MKFVASLTMNAADLRKAIQLWDASGDPRNPFADILISPLFTQPSTLKIVRDELKDKRGSKVYFDSGGYYVQQGRIEYKDLYGLLLDYYYANRWADWYVLPDWVPTSQDDPQVVEYKVRATYTVSKLFYSELPNELKDKVLPVVQGHTKSQIMDCMEMYSPIAVGLIGFGSFGTSGGTNGVNTVTDKSVELVRHLIELAQLGGNCIHLFGISTPPILYLFQQLGICSFDSMAWMKAAGFGNVFLPFMRGHLATYRTQNRTHTYREEFEHIKTLTRHECPFCEKFSTLTSNRMYRIMHNLFSIIDTLDLLNNRSLSHLEIMQIIELGSPYYLRYYEVVQ